MEKGKIDGRGGPGGGRPLGPPLEGGSGAGKAPPFYREQVLPACKPQQTYDGYNLNGLRTAADRHVATARHSAAAAPRGDMRTSIPRTLSAHGS